MQHGSGGCFVSPWQVPNEATGGGMSRCSHLSREQALWSAWADLGMLLALSYLRGEEGRCP